MFTQKYMLPPEHLPLTFLGEHLMNVRRALVVPGGVVGNHSLRQALNEKMFSCQRSIVSFKVANKFQKNRQNKIWIKRLFGESKITFSCLVEIFFHFHSNLFQSLLKIFPLSITTKIHRKKHYYYVNKNIRWSFFHQLDASSDVITSVFRVLIQFLSNFLHQRIGRSLKIIVFNLNLIMKY